MRQHKRLGRIIRKERIQRHKGQEKENREGRCQMTRIANFTDYQEQAARTLKPNRPFEDDLADYTLGLSEAGELQNKLKKYLYHAHPMDKTEIKEELGDLLWYMAAIATTLKIELGDVAAENIEKLKKRYPNGYSDKKSRERVIEREVSPEMER